MQLLIKPTNTACRLRGKETSDKSAGGKNPVTAACTLVGKEDRASSLSRKAEENVVLIRTAENTQETPVNAVYFFLATP